MRYRIALKVSTSSLSRRPRHRGNAVRACPKTPFALSFGHRANLLTEDTDPFCRLPLATLSRKPKAFRLGDRLRYKVRSKDPQRPLASLLQVVFLKSDPNCDNQTAIVCHSVFPEAYIQAAQSYFKSRLPAKKRRKLSKPSCRSRHHLEQLVLSPGTCSFEALESLWQGNGNPIGFKTFTHVSAGPFGPCPHNGTFQPKAFPLS